MSGKIRVLLVDDHTLFRSGIKSLLQRNEAFEVVGEAGDGLEGIKRARSLKPDVVLLDLHMPGSHGLMGLASLRATLQPAASQARYFVARGDGSSQFSATLDEHNQAVRRYILSR